MNERTNNKQYKTTCIVLKNKEKKLLTYCNAQAQLAKLFKNAVIYRCRQLYFAYKKEYKNLTLQEQQVIDEFAIVGISFPLSNQYQYLPTYVQFDAMFKATYNNDYYNNLPMQTTQQLIKEVLQDFKSYRAALKEYYHNSGVFTGKPKLPHYVKGDVATFTITNQDAVIKKDNTLKLPKTKCVVCLGNLQIGKLKEVQIKSFYDTYKICLVEELNDNTAIELDATRILGIDLGIDNIVSTSNNCGLTPFVINGNGLKSYNQWYNKVLAELKSQLPLNQYSSNKIQFLNKKHHNKTTDFYNKCVSYLVNYCIANNIGTIVVGKNTQWKTSSNIGKINNQNFCFIAHSILINKLQLLANKFGITVVITEESYTSKASFLDNDDIPNYVRGNKTKYQFSGKRIHRGLYKSSTGILINADVNGSSNIIRKAIPDAFDKITDYSYLYKTTNKIVII